MSAAAATGEGRQPEKGRRQHRTAPLISDRALNRAFLARQLLLERSSLPPAAAIAHLIGLQAQAPHPPYFALWSRLAGFAPGAVADLLRERALVRLATLRGTIFLMTAPDAHGLRPLVQPVFARALQPMLRDHFATVDQAAVLAAGRAHLRATPQTWETLGAALAGEWPGVPPSFLARLLRDVEALVQVPPRGLWGESGPAAHALLADWAPPAADLVPMTLPDLARRYLAAYGPASVRDMQAWTGLTKLGAVFTALRPELVTFTSESGAELFDLPEAPRPDADTPAPARFLAEFDVALLSHADKGRLLSPRHKAAVFTINGIIRGTILVDGHVAGIWRRHDERERATLRIETFAPLAPATAADIAAEGERLLRFAAPQRAPVVEIVPYP